MRTAGVFCGVALVLASVCLEESLTAQEVGPAEGSLVLVGGGMADPTIVERFLELAGGVDVPIVVIPTAGGADTYDQQWAGLDSFARAGATRLTVLHTTERDRSNTDAFVRPLRDARGVWFSGGRQWRLADAYLDTKVHDAVRAVLERGGVVGGSSAGATILGEYLARGDTQTNTVMMGDHEAGMALLRGVAVDQHLLVRNRQFDLVEVIRARPDLLGLGLDEDTAIVVQGDRFEVIGQSYVVVYDHQRMLDSGGLFYFLAPGDRFDLRNRQPFPRSDGSEGFDRVITRPWTDR